jgi:major membrane immunogen (membrane-anchored lipoprotein)
MGDGAIEKGGCMTQKNGTWIWILMGVAIVALLFTGCASKRLTPDTAPKVFSCAAGEKVEKDIAPEAELADFSCSFKKWKGATTLHFKVAVKNVSQQPQRYRVNIFLDNGKAVGGLIPRKTKKGLVKPGDTASFVYPIKDMATQPKGIFLKISPMGK